jgi:hypothetical protein
MTAAWWPLRPSHAWADSTASGSSPGRAHSRAVEAHAASSTIGVNPITFSPLAVAQLLLLDLIESARYPGVGEGERTTTNMVRAELLPRACCQRDGPVSSLGPVRRGPSPSEARERERSDLDSPVADATIIRSKGRDSLRGDSIRFFVHHPSSRSWAAAPSPFRMSVNNGMSHRAGPAHRSVAVWHPYASLIRTG